MVNPIIPPIPTQDKGFHPLQHVDLAQHIGSFLHPKEMAIFAQVNLFCHKVAPFSLMQSLREKQFISFEQLDSYRKSFKLSNFSQLFNISSDSSCLENLDLSFSNTDDAKLIEIIVNCPKLISINLTSCAFITDTSVRTLIDNCPNLRWINLNGCFITDASIGAIADKYPDLSNIYLKNCALITNAAVIALADKCPYLTQINLKGCTLITNAAVIALADKCPKLTYTVLTGCPITDAAVMALAHKCPNLTHINLANCELITDAALIMLADNCTNLAQIILAGCALITDAAIGALANRCTKLNMINLYNCLLISNAAIEAIANNCPNLTKIYLASSVTDAGVKALADKCTNLKLISLYNCSSITDAAIGALADKCTNLTWINLYNCSSLTDLSFVFLAKCGHKLRGIYGEFPERYGHVPENISFWQNLKKEFSYTPLTELGKECSKALSDITSEGIRQDAKSDILNNFRTIKQQAKLSNCMELAKFILDKIASLDDIDKRKLFALIHRLAGSPPNFNPIENLKENFIRAADALFMLEHLKTQN